MRLFSAENGNMGACGYYSSDAEEVVGLPLEFYNDTGIISSYCGTYVVVTNPSTNITVTARVADASATNSTLSLSIATWKALDGTDTDLTVALWRFANATETALVESQILALSLLTPSSTDTPSSSSSSSSLSPGAPAPIAADATTPISSTATTSIFISAPAPTPKAAQVQAAPASSASVVSYTPAVEPTLASSSSYTGSATYYTRSLFFSKIDEKFSHSILSFYRRRCCRCLWVIA